MSLKSILAGTLASLTLVGGGTAFAIAGVNNSNSNIEKVNAATKYYLTGEFSGVSHWDNYKAAPGTDKNVGELLNVELHVGDLFKFKLESTWNNALNFGNVYSGSSAYYAFYWQNGSDNIYCGAAGVYNFYIWDDNGTDTISIEFADTNKATYSYVLTSNSGFTNTYMWSGDQKEREWASAPSIDKQAYDFKFTYNNYDYYGLYRIDDRILNGWTGLILKNSSEQSADIVRTSGNKEELYMCGSSVTTFTKTSEEYKAVKVMAEIAIARAPFTYQDFSFYYSVCAIDSTSASNLISIYDSLTTGKALFDDAYLTTYDLSGQWSEDTKKQQKFTDVVKAVRVVANRNSVNGLNSAFRKAPQMNTVIIICVIGLSVIAVAGIFIVIKKKKFEK